MAMYIQDSIGTHALTYLEYHYHLLGQMVILFIFIGTAKPFSKQVA